MKLNSKITTLTAQQASKEASKTAQVATITAAETILAAEPEITAGVAHYKTLLEREKELIKGKAAYDSLATRKQQIESAITLAESAAKDTRQKKAALTLMKIGPLAQAIERAAELTEKHQQYEAATAQLAELEKLLPEFTAARDNLTTWQTEAERTERDYREAKTRLEGRIASLKEKVELLKDSGCPAPENATCKFLADALAARDALPGEEAALASLEEERGKLRQTNADALSAAQQAFDDKKHVPEEIDALRASLRLLEAAERDYNNLEAQRSELALLEERAAELEKSVADAEATAAKGREELAAVEQQLEQAAAYSRDYDELQRTLLTESRWLDKEKQLPVAREQKAAAAQRILELGSELTEIEEEIREARAELADEQSKTVGREELQAQVDAAEAKVKAVQKQAQELSLFIGGLQAKLGQIRLARKQAAELQEQMNELGGKAAGYEELKKAFSQDGIPHNIIRSIIPVFEATATNILGQMSQGRMSVEFVTEKVLKSNSKKEVTTLDIIINDTDTGRLPYMSRSGGERVKAALSVILALSEIKSSKAGVQLGFLFIDEPPFLDAPGVQAYCDALEAIQQRYGDLKVMAITHDPAMKSRFPQSVDVVKTPEGSKVIYE